MKIDRLLINEENPPVFVAEISANHAGRIEAALETISMAKQAGADLVKIQTYTPDTLTIPSQKPDFLIKDGLWKGKSLYELYSKAYTPFEWHKQLFEHAAAIGIPLISTPFDESAVDLLESLDVPAYKVASFEIVDLPLLKYIATTKKPVILSTGMANLQEIREAVETLVKNGTENLIILHCVSGYPTPVQEANVSTITKLKSEFPDFLIGLSDHTTSAAAASVAVALGACLVEKHVTLSKDLDSPDVSFSLTQEEISEHKKAMTESWKALGHPSFDLKKAEKENRIFRRSLYVVKDIKKGDVFSSENLRRIRPGFGLSPKYYEDVLGKIATMDIEAGTALTLASFQ